MAGEISTAALVRQITSSPLTRERETIGGRIIVPGAISPTDEKTPSGKQCFPFTFPLCNPEGCDDPTVAPIRCEDCRKTETEFAIFGMLILSFMITVANILVIRVILRSPSLRRRHGYIKLSMATSDLLVGLLVIPAAIANIFLTLYYPREIAYEKGKLDASKRSHINQKNSTASLIFGVVAVISVVSSLYNLFLLSADRFVAIARPLKYRAGKYFPKKTLFYSISSVWIFAVVLSMVPAFIPQKVYYEMDLATFFFVQRVVTQSSFSSIYIGVIIGGPYVLTVSLIILTAAFTWKNLKIRNRLSSRGNLSKSAIQRKDERRNRLGTKTRHNVRDLYIANLFRIKMIQEAYPDVLMEDDMNVASIKDYERESNPGSSKKKSRDWRRTSSSSENRCWHSWWKRDDCVIGNRPHNSNNNSNESDGSPRYQRTRDQMSIVREILNPAKAKVRKFNRKSHIRIFKMLTAMIICFSICLLPYVVVMMMVSKRPPNDCTSMRNAYIFAMYALFMNSLMNFVIYNLLHPEFRHRLAVLLRHDLSKPEKIKHSIGAMFSGSEQPASNRNDSATVTTSFS